MKTIRFALVTVCSLGLAVPALAAQQASQSGAMGMQGQQQDIGNLPVPKDPQEVLNELHAGNQKEIQLAQLAQQKSTNPQVRQLAQQILQDHQQADQQVQQLAKSMKISLSQPKGGDVQDAFEALSKDFKTAMQKVQGKPFDQLYTTDMVLDHNKDIQTFSAARDNLRSSNPQVAQLLDQMIPTFTTHREMAMRTLHAVEPKQGTGVGGSGMMQPGQTGTLHGMGMQPPAQQGQPGQGGSGSQDQSGQQSGQSTPGQSGGQQ